MMEILKWTNYLFERTGPVNGQRSWTTARKKGHFCLYVHIIYECMYTQIRYACTYLCMYVCMYVCMYLRICVSLGECMYVSMLVNICVMDNWIQFITCKCFSCAPQQDMASLALYYPAYPAVLSRTIRCM